jgi:hypothetical protein
LGAKNHHINIGADDAKNAAILYRSQGLRGAINSMSFAICSEQHVEAKSSFV